MVEASFFVRRARHDPVVHIQHSDVHQPGREFNSIQTSNHECTRVENTGGRSRGFPESG